MITLDLKRCKKQADILDWAFAAIDGMADYEYEDNFDSRPRVTPEIKDGIASFPQYMLDELLDRLEMYLELAESADLHEECVYANEERAVNALEEKLKKVCYE